MEEFFLYLIVFVELSIPIVALIINMGRRKPCIIFSCIAIGLSTIVATVLLLMNVGIIGFWVDQLFLYFLLIAPLMLLTVPFDVLSLLFCLRITSHNKANSPKQIKSQEADKDQYEEILKYKDLLDKGVITQEEFELKKKKILSK